MKIRIGNKTKEISLLSQDENKVDISVDDKIYHLDIVMAENGLCSIIAENGRSYNAELKPSENGREYTVSVAFKAFNVEILNNYQHFLKKNNANLRQDRVFTPMPGKVVKILVNEGDEVKAGSPVIIVEAMKMQSEYKVSNDCIIKKILVKEGENIAGNQTLIELKPLESEPNN
jgi:biotin carboxyl carrier protein